MGKKKRTMTEVISLIAAILALATAIIGLFNSIQNTTEISLQEEKINELQTIIMRLSFQIIRPRDNEIFRGESDIDMEGTFLGQLPKQYKLWALAHDNYNYFLLYPPTQFVRTMGRWHQNNIRLNTNGVWELHICIANEHATAWFEDRASRKDFSGFSSLPEGAETIKYVEVLKQ